MSEIDRAIYVPITKVEEADDGSLYVYGKVSDETLDSDQQITDSAAFKVALQNWFDNWANIRVMHQPIAVGVAKEIAFQEDESFIGAKIVDADAVRKVQEGVYKGFSYGVAKGKYRVVPDPHAPRGRILIDEDGMIEGSLADRPSNPTAKIILAKIADADLEKREFSEAKREDLADEGKALPDGSYPIANTNDLKNAIQAYGRAKNKAAVKRHIIKRARALGATDLLPEDWGKVAEPGLTKADESGDVSLAQRVIDALKQLIISEASEDEDAGWDLYTLVQVLMSMESFRNHEQWEAVEEAMGRALEPELTKIGAELSGKNKAFLQAMHDTIAKMMPDACGKSDGDDGDKEDDDMDKATVAEWVKEVLAEQPELLKAAQSDDGEERVTREELDALKAEIAELGKRAQPAAVYTGGAQRREPPPADGMRDTYVELSKSSQPDIAGAARQWLEAHPAE